jgi:hypothetical protein
VKVKVRVRARIRVRVRSKAAHTERLSSWRTTTAPCVCSTRSARSCHPAVGIRAGVRAGVKA